MQISFRSVSHWVRSVSNRVSCIESNNCHMSGPWELERIWNLGLNGKYIETTSGIKSAWRAKSFFGWSHLEFATRCRFWSAQYSNNCPKQDPILQHFIVITTPSVCQPCSDASSFCWFADCFGWRVYLVCVFFFLFAGFPDSPTCRCSLFAIHVVHRFIRAAVFSVCRFGGFPAALPVFPVRRFLLVPVSRFSAGSSGWSLRFEPAAFFFWS